MKWKLKLWRKRQKKVQQPILPRAIANANFCLPERKSFHDDGKYLQPDDDSGFRLSTGSRLTGHEDNPEDIFEALRRSQAALDEIGARYPDQLRRRASHVPFLVPMLSIEPRPSSGHGLPGKGTQGDHPPMQKLACQMIRVTEDQDISCGKNAGGITTDGVYVCFTCGLQMRSEGFLVLPLMAWRRPRELLFPFAQVGDRFRFIYPEEPQFDMELTVTEVKGYQPNDLVFFSDGTHCKQHVIGTLERIS